MLCLIRNKIYFFNGSHIATSFIEISNIFGSHWSDYSNDINFQPEFIRQKSIYSDASYNPSNVSLAAKKIENKVSKVEFECTFQGVKRKTPGFDE